MGIAMLLAGCSNDAGSMPEPNRGQNEKPPVVTPGEFRVAVGAIGDREAEPSSRVTFEDGVGLRWEADDWKNFNSCVVGTAEVHHQSSGMEIDADDRAVFSFNTSMTAGQQVWFFYARSDNFAGKKYEATIASAQTQAAPGTIGGENIILRSANYDITQQTVDAVDPLMLKMYPVGTLQRFLIYSPTGIYAEEKVQSIVMTATENIAGLFGYNPAGQPINNAQEVQSVETIYWNQAKTITTTVTAPEAVTAVDKNGAKGRGIYMTVAPGTVSAGYTYTITTDRAIYTLLAPAAKTFANGTILNIGVNLESKAVKRVSLDALALRYVGSLDSKTPYKVSYEAGKSGLGYWYAVVNDGTSDTNHASFPADAAFYSTENVKFEATDESGNPVSWITCAYRANDTWWDVVFEANTGASRTAVITATYDIPGYNCTTPIKKVTVTQAAYTNEQVLTYPQKNIGNISTTAPAREYNTGLWFVAYINDVARDGGFHGENYYRNVTISPEEGVDWVSFRLPDNSNNIWANVLENPGAERSATVTVKYTGTQDGYTVSDADRIIGTFVFTQKAKENAVEARFSIWHNEWYTEITSSLAKSVPAAGCTDSAMDSYYLKIDGADVSGADRVQYLTVRSTDDSWLSGTVDGGSGNLLCTCAENGTGAERSGELKVYFTPPQTGAYKVDLGAASWAGEDPSRLFTITVTQSAE